MMCPRASIKGESGAVPGVATLLWEFLFGKAGNGNRKLVYFYMATRPFLEKGNTNNKGGQVIECFR
jgi:hypothetical protein